MRSITEDDVERFAEAIEQANEKVRVRIYFGSSLSRIHFVLSAMSFAGICTLLALVVWR